MKECKVVDASDGSAITDDHHDSENYRFHYNGGILSGYSNSSFDIIEFTVVHTFHDDGKESFSVKSFMVEYDSTELDSVI